MRNQRKLEKLSKKSGKLIENLLKKGEVNQEFLDFIRGFPEKDKQAQFWEKLLSRKDLTPDNLYLISQKINEEFEKLKIGIEQKYAKAAADDDLLAVLRIEDPFFGKIIWLELSQRIQRYVKKHRTRKQAIEILKKVFESIERYRKEAWQIMKFLGLPDDELQHLSNLPFMYSQPDLQAEIQVLIKKRRKIWGRKDYNTTAIPKIQQIMREITELKGEQ